MTAFCLLLALASPAITISVAPETNGGFVDTTNKVLESVGHVQSALRDELKKTRFVLSDVPSAHVRVELGRDQSTVTGGESVAVTQVGNTAYGYAYENKKNFTTITAIAVVGAHRQPFVAVEGSSKKAAKRIAKELSEWLRANEARLSEANASR